MNEKMNTGVDGEQSSNLPIVDLKVLPFDYQVQEILVRVYTHPYPVPYETATVKLRCDCGALVEAKWLAEDHPQHISISLAS